MNDSTKQNDKKYIVYIYRNTVNGKLYVGQTCNIKKRCTENSYKGSNYFYHAIQKYGFDNFEQIIVKEDLTKELADYWEKLFIKFFDCTNHSYGYNISSGGQGATLYGKDNGFYNKRHNEESLKIMKEKKGGGNNPMAKPVICINTGEVFPSCKEASDWCGASRQHISRVCRGERKHTGRHPKTGEMLEWRYLDDKSREN